MWEHVYRVENPLKSISFSGRTLNPRSTIETLEDHSTSTVLAYRSSSSKTYSLFPFWFMIKMPERGGLEA